MDAAAVMRCSFALHKLVGKESLDHCWLQCLLTKICETDHLGSGVQMEMYRYFGSSAWNLRTTVSQTACYGLAQLIQISLSPNKHKGGKLHLKCAMFQSLSTNKVNIFPNVQVQQ